MLIFLILLAGALIAADFYVLVRARARPAHSTAQVPIRQYPTRHGM